MEPASGTEATPEPAAPARPRWWQRPLWLYTREFPAALHELRWALLVVIALYLAGALIAHFGAYGIWLGRLAHDPRYRDGAPISMSTQVLYALSKCVSWYPCWPAFIDSPRWAGTWYGLFIHNAASAIYSAIGALLSAGLWSVRTAFGGGWGLTWGCQDMVLVARTATGLSAPGAIFATVMPHGALEMPALWLAYAAALRAGLSWAHPRLRVRRRQSMARAMRCLGVILAATLPVLCLTATIEVTTAPLVRNRYLLGIGTAPGMTSERRAMPNGWAWSDYLGEASLSPDGRHLAAVSRSDRGLYVGRLGPGRWPRLAAIPPDALGTPSFSHDARRLAYVFNDWGHNGRLYVADLQARKQAPVAGGPPGCYLSAAWSPRADVVAVAVAPYGRDGADPGPADLWVVDLTTNRWVQVTHFTRGNGLTLASAPAWSPDGGQVAFSRLGDAGSLGLWVIRNDGSGLRQLITGSRAVNPAWSPRGDRIAFVTTSWGGNALPGADEMLHDRYARNYLSLIRADGTGRQDGLAKVDSFCHPSWYPDGKRLLYLRGWTAIAGAPREGPKANR
jgi:Tol biopolymer transport system component